MRHKTKKVTHDTCVHPDKVLLLGEREGRPTKAKQQKISLDNAFPFSMEQRSVMIIF